MHEGSRSSARIATCSKTCSRRRPPSRLACICHHLPGLVDGPHAGRPARSRAALAGWQAGQCSALTQDAQARPAQCFAPTPSHVMRARSTLANAVPAAGLPHSIANAGHYILFMGLSEFLYVLAKQQAGSACKHCLTGQKQLTAATTSAMPAEQHMWAIRPIIASSRAARAMCCALALLFLVCLHCLAGPPTASEGMGI